MMRCEKEKFSSFLVFEILKLENVKKRLKTHILGHLSPKCGKNYKFKKKLFPEKDAYDPKVCYVKSFL